MGQSPLLSCGGAGGTCCAREAASDSACSVESRYCRRPCGLDALETELISCDPAGVVFDDTISQLPELDRAAFRVAASANLAALRWLFVFGASAKALDSNGTSLLHVACRTGSLFVVKDLVRRGLPLTGVDNAGWTPLHVASCMGRQEVSLYLLQSGAKPHVKNAKGQTPEELCSQPCTKEVVLSYDAQAKGSASFARSAFAESGPNLHFEPFFVPRDPVLHQPRSREDLQQLGVDLFGRSAGHGVAFLVAVGVVKDYPVEINNFLVRMNADPCGLGEFLGEEYPISQTLRLEFLNSLPLLGTGVVSALEAAFREMTCPACCMKVDRLTRGIAHFWWKQHDEEAAERKIDGGQELQPMGARGEVAGLELQRCLLGTEGLHRLMYSTLMLQRWLLAEKTMTLNEWLQLNMGIEGSGNDVPMHVQSSIYRAVTEGCLGQARVKPKPPPAAVTVEGWAFVHYTGRAQVTHDGDPAAWPEASPRRLAALGGVSSAGRAAPLPGCESDGVPCVAQSISRLRPANRSTCGITSTEAMSVYAQPFDSENEAEEEAWLSLHQWILLFSSKVADESTPYAFVPLCRVVLKEIDSVNKRLILVGLGEQHWPPSGTAEDEWLELFLLLGDGRFQPMEAPRLELRLGKAEDFQVWAERLQELCHDPEAAAAWEGRHKEPKLESW